MTAQNPRLGILLMIAAICLFTLMDAAAKGLIARYPVGMVVWARFAVMALAVALILRHRLPALARTRHPGMHLLRSVCQLGATGMFFASLAHIGLAEATAITDLNPVLITLGAAVFLGERLGPRRLFGVGASILGALIVIRPGADVFSPAALLPLGAAICYATNVLITRKLGPVEPVWTPMIHAAAICTAITSAALPFVWVTPAAADLPQFVLIGLLGTAAQLCLIRAFTFAEAGLVAPFAYVGIVLASVWGILFFGQWPDGWTVVGAIVIVAAGLYVWHRETVALRS
jgi:drug/metabolite transporter (DMT)-like permease